MATDICLVIRSIGERTTAVCAEAARRELGCDRIEIINEKPFIKALRRSFEVGLDSRRSWTAVLDADVILLPGAIDHLMAAVNKADKQVFSARSMVLDKLFYCGRGSAIHLYSTPVLEQAIKEIPKEGISLRPESFVIKKMQEKGFADLHIDEIGGVHDFEQYYHDVFNKAFFHGRKHRRYKPYLEKLWKVKAREDKDYLVARYGFQAGISHQGHVLVGENEPVEKIKDRLDRLGIREKGELMGGESFHAEVQKLVENYREPDAYGLYLDIFNGREIRRGFFRTCMDKIMYIFRG